MCTPAVSMAMTALGTVSQMQAASAQASAQASAYSAEAQVARNNAAQAQAQAASNAVAGAQKAGLGMDKARQVQASQAVALSANGLDIGQGSALDILADTEQQGKLDKANTLYNTATNTWMLQNQANDYNNQASVYDAASSNAKAAGKINSMTSLLTGVSSLAGQYANYSNSGAITSKTAAAVPDYRTYQTASGTSNFFPNGSYDFNNPIDKITGKATKRWF